MLECRKLRKTFSGFVATDDVSLTVETGSIAAIIGPNGAGKSTLFNVITGHLEPDSGEVLLEGRNITGIPPHKICGMGIARSFQRTNIFSKLTVYENIQAAFIAHGGKGLDMWGVSERQFRDETGQMIEQLSLQDIAVHAGRRGQPRRAKAGGARHRAGGRAAHAASRRAHRRHERAGDA